MSAAHEILTEAAGIVAGARNASHGEKERSFIVIANLWNAYLDGRKTPGPISPRDVAQLMTLLKIGRSIQGTAAPDHFLDQAGYSAIAGELAAAEVAASGYAGQRVAATGGVPMQNADAPWAVGDKAKCINSAGFVTPLLTQGKVYDVLGVNKFGLDLEADNATRVMFFFHRFVRA